MSTQYPGGTHNNNLLDFNFRKRRRQNEISTSSSDSLEEYPLKRSAFCSVDIVETSPLSPESGIETDSPCYSNMSIITVEAQLDQCKHGLWLTIVDEPEENYRARYDSEGCRGPMKGRNGGCPTVEVTGDTRWSNGDLKVELVAADRSALNSCKLDSSEDGTNLNKKVHPGEKISFENLRIRRLKKGDASSKANNRHHSTAGSKGTKSPRGKQDEKVAYLLFTATIKSLDYGDIQLKVLSQAVHLNASHEPPEVHCIVPQYGSVGDQIAIIGTRMHSPRVSFFVNVDGKEKEIVAEVNKEVSHQNALVVKVPALPGGVYINNIANVHICVTAGKGDRTGKEPLKSMPSPFRCVMPGFCKDCCISSQTQHSSLNSFGYKMFCTPLAPSVPYQQPVILNVTKPISTTKRIGTPPPPLNTSGCQNYLVPSPPVGISGYMSSQPSQGSLQLASIGNIYPTSCVGSSITSSALLTNQSHMDTQQDNEVEDIISTLCDPPDTSDTCPITPLSGSIHSPPHVHSPYMHQTETMMNTESMIDGLSFSNDPSGPVSPDEFNQYLPHVSESTVVTLSPSSFVPVSTSSQEYPSVLYSGGCQPNSLGYPQNP